MCIGRLIEGNGNSQTYSMHAVVHDWIQASIDRRKDEGLLQTAITTIGLVVPEQNARDSATVQRRILPHVIQLLQHWSYVTDVKDHFDTFAYINSLQMLGDLCSNQGKLAETEEMYQRALKGKEKALGVEHTSTLDTVNNLGSLYKDQGKLAEA
jgi:tetratricopeptide (TPR) repeat protein